MSNHSRAADHMSRLARQLGRPVMLGPRRYNVRGYISNIVDVRSVNEPELDIVLRRLLNRPGHFIDVGANLGQTLGKVLALDGERAYLGFEPQISACYFVNRFIRDNGLTNAQVLPFGLSSSNSICRFWTHGEADVMGSLIKGESHTSETTILTRIGDEVLKELGLNEIAAIKIDVEGAELDVLDGLRGTLQRVRPPVIFELLPNFEGRQRTRIPAEVALKRNAQARAIERFWHDLSYDIRQIAEDGSVHAISQFDIDSTEAFRGTNYMAVPKP